MEKTTTIYYNLNGIVSKAARFPGPACYIYILISLTTFFCFTLMNFIRIL